MVLNDLEYQRLRYLPLSHPARDAWAAAHATSWRWPVCSHDSPDCPSYRGGAGLQHRRGDRGPAALTRGNEPVCDATGHGQRPTGRRLISSRVSRSRSETVSSTWGL